MNHRRNALHHMLARQYERTYGRQAARVREIRNSHQEEAKREYEESARGNRDEALNLTKQIIGDPRADV